MAFFDNVSKKLSQASQEALQKTKDMADIARLNSSIADEEKRLNNNYYQIGKLYAQLHSNDYEDYFSVYMMAIIESNNKIDEFKNELQKLRAVTKCPGCGAEVPNSAAFCNVCGGVINPVVSNTVKCPNCNALVNKEMKFCTNCGYLMQQNKPVSEPSQDIKVEIKRSCSTCGAELDDDAVFCADCGTKVM